MAEAPAPAPSNYGEESQRKGYGALIMVLGLMVLLACLAVAAVIYVPKLMRARGPEADAEATQVVATPAGTPSAIVSSPPVAVNDHNPAPEHPASSAGFANTPAFVTKIDPPKTHAKPLGIVRRGSEADERTGESAMRNIDPPRTDEAELERLQQEYDQLTSRMSAVESTIATLKNSLAEQGLGLRSDVVSAQNRLHSNLEKLEVALQNRDLDSSRRLMQRCDRDAATLDQFVGQ